MRRPSRRFQAPGEASLGRPAMYDYWRGGDGEVMGHGAGNRQLLMGLSGEPFLFLDREWQKIRPANPKLNMNAATGKGKKKKGEGTGGRLGWGNHLISTGGEKHDKGKEVVNIGRIGESEFCREP